METNQLSCHSHIPVEWSLLPRVFNEICEVYGRPLLDLFVTYCNKKHPIYVFQFQILSLGRRMQSSTLGPPRNLYVSLVCYHKNSAQQGYGIKRPVDGSCSSFVATQGVVSRSVVPAGGRTTATSAVLEPVGLTTCLEVLSGSRHQTLFMGDNKWSIRKADFSEKGFSKSGFLPQKILSEPLPSQVGRLMALLFWQEY